MSVLKEFHIADNHNIVIYPLPCARRQNYTFPQHNEGLIIFCFNVPKNLDRLPYCNNYLLSVAAAEAGGGAEGERKNQSATLIFAKQANNTLIFPFGSNIFSEGAALHVSVSPK
jgi:hypothetical protein